MAQLGGSCSESLLRLQSSCWPELQSLQRLAGVGKSASKLIHMVVGRFMLLSGCWPEASVPHYVGLSIGQLTTWQLASPQKAREKSQREKLRERENNPASWKSQYFISSQKGHPFIFVTLSSLIVSHQAQPTLKGRGSHSMEIPEGGITGSILETAYYRLIFEQRNK